MPSTSTKPSKVCSWLQNIDITIENASETHFKHITSVASKIEI